RPWRRWTRQRSDPLPLSAHPARGPVRIVTLGHLNCRRAEIGNRLVRSCSHRLRRSPMSEAPVSRGVYKFAVFALAIGAFGIGVTEFATMGLLPMIAEELGITVPQAGHAVSFYAIGVVIGAPLITTIAAHMDRKLLLLCLMGLFALGNLVSMLAPTATLFNIARFASGLPGEGHVAGDAGADDREHLRRALRRGTGQPVRLAQRLCSRRRPRRAHRHHGRRRRAPRERRRR